MLCHVRHLKNIAQVVVVGDDLFEAGKEAVEDQQGNQENKRIAGTNEDTVSWAVVSLKV